MVQKGFIFQRKDSLLFYLPGRRRQCAGFFSIQCRRSVGSEVLWASVLFHLFKERSMDPRMGKHRLKTASFLFRNDVFCIFGPFSGGIHIIDKTWKKCTGY